MIPKIKDLVSHFPKTTALLYTAAVAAAGAYGGPLAAEAARELLVRIFG